MARPRKEIDWSDVEKLCGLQCTQEEIAQFCDVSQDTLTRHCQDEFGMSFAEFFEQKRGAGRISLRRSQWQLAQKGNPTMLIWLGKQYLSQRDKTSTELSGPEGRPIETRSLGKLTDEELEKEIQGYLNRPTGTAGDAGSE
jgi:hypothetical protein